MTHGKLKKDIYPTKLYSAAFQSRPATIYFLAVLGSRSNVNITSSCERLIYGLLRNQSAARRSMIWRSDHRYPRPGWRPSGSFVLRVPQTGRINDHHLSTTMTVMSPVSELFSVMCHNILADRVWNSSLSQRAEIGSGVGFSMPTFPDLLDAPQTRRAFRQSRKIRVAFASVTLLASLAFAWAPHAAPSNSAATEAADKALYAYITRYPLHRGYLYCLVSIEYTGDFQSRFCPGSRVAIVMAQKALNQPIVDFHDDKELRRILLMISKNAKDDRASQPEQGTKTVGPGSLGYLYRLHEKDRIEPAFLYCYSDILFFAEFETACCRYSVAKFNLELFEGSEQLLPERDAPVLFSVLKSIISKEKP
ncbi:hypothetical protein FHT80_002096 [Rhizobium sp. BK226]|uniref:hypothetical protein n=1 Tax=Rhizobium sp. BK226 TaxID=2587075 RepID=UPI00161FF986|nr:hypothetical protein [Rhizobium sp. BK226]MBB4112777.1 hypothetical protein [Rhizobium sp. BK226]